MVATEIRLLGPPSLVAAGRPVRLHSAKTLALLAFLTLETGAAHSREKLAGLLWGDSPDSRARQSLRQALYSLRRALGPDLFVPQDNTVVFELRASIWVDALEFRALAADGAQSNGLDALSKAAELYRGLLLEGSEPSDCPAFDEWLFFQRDGLEQHALDVIQRLVDGFLDRGDPQNALAYARRLPILNPLHEGAHRRLMRVYSALGDLDGVRRQYRLCVGLLERELGAEPTDETQALYRALVTVRPTSISSRDRLPPSRLEGPLLTLPFLGRDRELALLQEQFVQALRGQGRLILVSGEAGVGKTRLVEEFFRCCTEQTEQPVRALAGRCHAPESRAPYAMWADALQDLARPDWQSHLAGLDEIWHQQVARLVPTLGTPARDIEGVTPAESRLRLLQGIVQVLTHLTQASILCLWLDDLHWADEASLELLHYVSRHTTAHPLFVLGTYRPAAVADNPPLRQLLSVSRASRASRGSDAVHIVQLASLDEETIYQMLRQAGIAAQKDLAERLYQHTEGNPLVLVETLNTLSESGQLHPGQDDGTVVPQIQSWPVPSRIQDLIQARMASLDEEQRRALAAGAVIGRPFDLRLLRLVSGLPELQALDTIEQILRRGFLDERLGSPAGSTAVLPAGSPNHPMLAFHHAYFQRVIYEGLSTVQRRALHRRAAGALLQLYQARPQIVTEELAHHYEQAGDAEAVTYLAQAAQQAQELYAYQRAAELCSRALDRLVEHRPGDLEKRFDLLLVREAVLDRQGRRSEQAADVKELTRLAEAMDDTERLAVASVRQSGFLSYTGRYDDARQAGERALALYRTANDRVGEGQALRELGFLSWSAEDYSAALAYGRDALQLHRRRGDVEGEATALHNLAEIHRSLGSPRQSVAQYENALELYWARQDRRRQGLTLYGMGNALRQLEDLEGASLRYRQALDHCKAAGDRLMASRVHHALTGIHRQNGASGLALDHMQQAVAISREIGYGPGIAHGLIALSDLQAQEGCPDAARHSLEEAMTWLRLAEDRAGLEQAQARLRALEQGMPVEVTLLPTQVGWIKTHVALAEGKVYCAFESPVAHCSPSA